MKTRFYLPAVTLLWIAIFGLSCALGQDEPATRVFIDDAGRKIEVPVDPQRIVALFGGDGGIQTLSLGVPLVGLATRGGELDLKGLDLPSEWLEGVAPIGEVFEWDIEAIAALQPDLIIGSAFQGEVFGLAPEMLSKLERIAPFVALTSFKPIDQVMARFGELLGVDAEVERQQAAFEARVADIRERMPVDPSQVTIASVYFFPDEVRLNNQNVDALTQALHEIGVTFSPLVDEITETNQLFMSYERIGELNADLIFTNAGPLPSAARQLFNRLPAVEAGQVYEDNIRFSRTFGGLEAALDYLEPILTNPDLNADLVDEAAGE